MRRSSAFVAVIATLATVATLGGGAAFAAPGASAAWATIPGSAAAWATPGNRVADVNANDKMVFRVYLKMRDLADTEATARAVSDPKSPSYRHYLTPAQVRDRFAPTAQAVSAVKGWLVGAGFRIGEVPPNNMFVEAVGTTQQVARAFNTELGVYSVHGQWVRGASRPLSVPAPLADTVVGVIGVDQAMALLRPDHRGGRDDNGPGVPPAERAAPTTVPPPPGFRNAGPCSAYWAAKLDTTDPAYGGGFPNPLPYAPCGYKPGQLRAAYGVDDLARHGTDGRGTTVAIIDAFASPTLFQDAATYAARNDPSHPLGRDQFSSLLFPTNPDMEGPDQCDAAGWYGEQSLDVEAVHAMAPGAHILYVGGSDCQDISLDKALNAVVSANLARIVSNSYGDRGEDLPLDEIQAFQQIAFQAVFEGIGLYFSSGDNGDEAAYNKGAPTPDFAASSPWVTAVGGTSLGIDANGKRVVDTGWESGKSALTNGTWSPPAPGAFLYGSGGGTSRLFSEPFYQFGVVPDSLAQKNRPGGLRGRVVPDISMVGDPNTGMLIGITQTFPEGVAYGEYRIGGTSLAAPLFAGLMALADQADDAPHGFVNPALYELGVSRNGPIQDVLPTRNGVVRVDYANSLDASKGLLTSVRSFSFPGLFIDTRKGYDDVTGLGTPNGATFVPRI